MDEGSRDLRQPHRALVREVESPQHNTSGLGVMIIASAAMFFTVAGSALALRARLAHCDRVRHAVFAPAPLVAPQAQLPVGGPVPCGTPVLTDNADGTTTVQFTVCPGVEVHTVSAERQIYATPLPDEPGLHSPH